MRLLDPHRDVCLREFTLYLTRAEADQLQYTLATLVGQLPDNAHEHIHDDNYQHSLTVALYDPDHLESFDARSRRLISADDHTTDRAAS